MFKVKRARSVVHSTAHHAVSALSWLHPRLGEECESQNINEVIYDLNNSKIVTDNLEISTETKMAFSALKSTFESIANVEEINLIEVKSAYITFGFTNGNWPNYCICSITTCDGKLIEVKLDGVGKKYSLLSQYQNYG